MLHIDGVRLFNSTAKNKADAATETVRPVTAWSRKPRKHHIEMLGSFMQAAESAFPSKSKLSSLKGEDTEEFLQTHTFDHAVGSKNLPSGQRDRPGLVSRNAHNDYLMFAQPARLRPQTSMANSRYQRQTEPAHRASRNLLASQHLNQTNVTPSTDFELLRVCSSKKSAYENFMNF